MSRNGKWTVRAQRLSRNAQSGAAQGFPNRSAFLKCRFIGGWTVSEALVPANRGKRNFGTASQLDFGHF